MIDDCCVEEQGGGEEATWFPQSSFFYWHDSLLFFFNIEFCEKESLAKLYASNENKAIKLWLKEYKYDMH